MRKILKPFVALMLAVILLVPASLTALAANTVNIKLGTYVNGVLDRDTGELVISGTGPMTNYAMYSSPVTTYGSSITSVVIEPGVTSIGSNVFYSCDGILSVTIPDTVTSIGERAFWSCFYLSSVTIPGSVQNIGDYAFHYCQRLKTATILDGVKSIGRGAFGNCFNLSSVTIPNSVTSIGDGAFSNTGLESVVIPDSVTSIGGNALQGCKKLTSYTLPSSITKIPHGLFMDCTALTSITIPYGITHIETGAFSGCSSLTSVVIPDSVISIGANAFSRCTSLASVTIPNSVTSLADSAFAECPALTSVTIPESVSNIGQYAFKACSGLATIINRHNGVQPLDSSVLSNAGSDVPGPKIAYCYLNNTTFVTAAIAAGYTVMDIQYAPADPEPEPEQPGIGLPSYPDVYIIDADNDVAYIYGVVDPAVLSAEVTLSTYFHIAPNAPEGERFISPEMTIQNTSTMPIYVDAVSMVATGNAPKVVAHDKYSDEEWSKLGVADTAANIALGLTGAPTAGDFFFAAEDAQAPVRLNENLLSQATDAFGLQAKFGLSWPTAQTFKYDLTLAIGLRD